MAEPSDDDVRIAKALMAGCYFWKSPYSGRWYAYLPGYNEQTPMPRSCYDTSIVEALNRLVELNAEKYPWLKSI